MLIVFAVLVVNYVWRDFFSSFVLIAIAIEGRNKFYENNSSNSTVGTEKRTRAKKKVCLTFRPIKKKKYERIYRGPYLKVRVYKSAKSLAWFGRVYERDRAGIICCLRRRTGQRGHFIAVENDSLD